MRAQFTIYKMEGSGQMVFFKPLSYMKFSNLKLKVSAYIGHPTWIVEVGDKWFWVEKIRSYESKLLQVVKQAYDIQFQDISY